MRKLASIKRIDEINPIEGANAIEVATVGGWKVVVKKGEYTAGDLAVYFEIDSWIPHELAPFLSNGKEPREFEGVKGERLRTIKLRGQISQGLLLPVYNDFTGTYLMCYSEDADEYSVTVSEDDDVTELLGILRYERPLPAQLAGQAKGNFPSFIPKTDEERVQNLSKNLGKWSQSGDQWEISEKLDGSSMTVFFRNNAMNDADDFIAEFGVCSRNLQLKETEGNSFWGAARKYNLEEKLTALDRNIAIQGELVGPGIQGNKYKLTDIDFYVFTVYDIDTGEYLSSADRLELCEKLGLKHVPVLCAITLPNSGVIVDALLSMAEGKSKLNLNTEREGIVFKNIQNPQLHFKAISNKFLMKFED
jgi:RNA ligase (TIGR02306 family)